EDRTLPPVDEARREARRVLQPVGARTGDRALRRALQPPSAARGAAERDPGGRVRGTTADDLGPSRADQARDAGAAQAGESDGGTRKATCRECDLLTSPNGPEDSDDVQVRRCCAWSAPSPPHPNQTMEVVRVQIEERRAFGFQADAFRKGRRHLRA